MGRHFLRLAVMLALSGCSTAYYEAARADYRHDVQVCIASGGEPTVSLTNADPHVQCDARPPCLGVD